MRLEFSIKSSTGYLTFLRGLIRTFERAAPGGNVDHLIVSRCSLALVEAVNNAIFHAHKKVVDQLIDIVIDVQKKSIEMQVHDDGEGFDIHNMPEIPDDSTHGRGMLIIESVMDEVTYVRGKKNVLRMMCRLGEV